MKIGFYSQSFMTVVIYWQILKDKADWWWGVPDKSLHELLIKMTKQRTVPNVFVQGKHLGGCDKTIEKLESNEFFS